MVAPKVFVSYSWTSGAHESWVLALSKEIVENGVDVVIDKWDLREGQDSNAFMEKMVTDTSVAKVLIIADRKYKEKADRRTGGVGTESQIISGEIFKSVDQTKFVVVVAEKDEKGVPYIPAYYTSRIYIDMSDPQAYSKNMEQLIRWIFDKPLYQKPALGQPPRFLEQSDTPQIASRHLFRTAKNDFVNHTDTAYASVQVYLKEVAQGIERLRLSNTDKGMPIDERVLESIAKFEPIRAELLELFTLASRYLDNDSGRKCLHQFFNDLIPYLDRPESVTSWQEGDFDNFKYIISELFLTLIAILLRNGCFQSVQYLCKKRYFDKRLLERGKSALETFAVFSDYLQSLHFRNARLKLNRLSLKADIIKGRVMPEYASFEDLMQADCVLFLRDCFDAVKYSTGQRWMPDTLIYMTHWPKPLELFVRSEEKEYFNSVKIIFDIQSKDELVSLMEHFRDGKLRSPVWQFERLDVATLLNIGRIDTI